MTAKLWRINFKKNLSYDIIEAAEQPPYTANVSRFGCAIPLSRQFRGGFSGGEIQR